MKEDVFDISNHALSMSPFKDHFEQIKHSGNQQIKASSSTGKNNYHGDLLSGDLTRFLKNMACQLTSVKKAQRSGKPFLKTQKC